MKQHLTQMKILVEFEPNRFSSDSLNKVYKKLNDIQSYPITNIQKNDEVCITKTSKVGGNWLDEIVWQQVVELLKHPERLEKEHERRLDLLQQDKKVNNSYDTIALKKQKKSLDKGQSLLIDSYAEGLIDKEYFEPKIRQLKSKIQQINQQMEACQHHEVNQMELFLVVSRLEEFAKTVAGSLDSIDFNSQKEIIRALVKHVEIYKEEVNIVFRIVPQNDLSGNNGISTIKGKFMRHCKRITTPLAVFLSLEIPVCRLAFQSGLLTTVLYTTIPSFLSHAFALLSSSAHDRYYRKNL
jgi:hypothetical protein